ncbi:hypothetical protein VNO77_14601 [Canavalia gladiata]|uniref:Arginine decarboxylase n=1 Tax=Canavalia gladiata TaxID=3824 RepID=A0AAN9LYW5_CANGL
MRCRPWLMSMLAKCLLLLTIISPGTPLFPRRSHCPVLQPKKTPAGPPLCLVACTGLTGGDLLTSPSTPPIGVAESHPGSVPGCSEEPVGVPLARFRFCHSIAEPESRYQSVYPLKSNQDRFIAKDIMGFGSPFRFGLEAGSKAELLPCTSCLCKDNRESFLVCNGYKDKEYISLALLARKFALNIVIVLEQEEERDSVIDISVKLCIRPVIGIFVKLRTMHSGHFGSTSGDKGKLSLTTFQILRVVNKLEQVGMFDCLQPRHFHIGSQIPSTVLLSGGVVEATQIYCELVRLGASDEEDHTPLLLATPLRRTHYW